MAEAHRVTIAAGGRFLQTADGNPFFWLGDTAWELAHRLTRDEILLYLDTRQSQGFNVIQMVGLAEIDGLTVPNAEGHVPLKNLDPNQPNEAYWDLIDWIFDRAEERGLIIALLPTWGDKILLSWGVGPVIFDETNARSYGEWIAKRYGHRDNLIWVIGGDRRVEDKKVVFRAMAEGIKSKEPKHHLMTFHPQGGNTSLTELEGETWLEASMGQSGHWWYRAETDLVVAQDWAKAPMPFLDGEPCYESHLPFKAIQEMKDFTLPRFDDRDVRLSVYASVFAGGCGFTYGCDSVWQFYDWHREPVNHPSGPWRQSLHLPGAWQVRLLKDLILSRTPLDRGPANHLILSGAGEGHEKALATANKEQTWAMVFVPDGRRLKVDSQPFGSQMRITLFNPRTGETSVGSMVDGWLEAPSTQDWVWILDKS
ncbi:MAG: glycoside hydrolase family 140 protein [Fimbriimonadaceae bacterium]|jgi:hypothetical protein|nr:glycoside hydrolase family 140 protein [Fimbriimonadaceae bacterium]